MKGIGFGLYFIGLLILIVGVYFVVIKGGGKCKKSNLVYFMLTVMGFWVTYAGLLMIGYPGE